MTNPIFEDRSRPEVWDVMGHEPPDDYETWATAEGQREADDIEQRALDEALRRVEESA